MIFQPKNTFLTNVCDFYIRMRSGVSSISDKNICNTDFCTHLLPLHIKKLMHTIVASRYHKLEPEKEKPLTKHSLRVKY